MVVDKYIFSVRNSTILLFVFIICMVIVLIYIIYMILIKFISNIEVLDWLLALYVDSCPFRLCVSELNYIVTPSPLPRRGPGPPPGR